MSTYELPIIVNGEEIWSTDAPPHEIHCGNGSVIRLPRLTDELKKRILGAPRFMLSSLHLDEITVFLDRVGKLWRDPKYQGLQEALALGPIATGYDQSILQSDYARIGRACDRAKLYDIVDTDLGDSLLLDEWMPRQSVLLKALPRGRALHLMVGNVPLAGLYTIVRGVLTKNMTIAKLPKRDVVSTLNFARTFIAIDPSHAITRSLTVVYWPGGSEDEDEFIQAADVICAWGRGDSIRAVKPKVPVGANFLEFGPKESIILVDQDAEDSEELAFRIAHDLSVYDQEACFSPQRLFVHGDGAELMEQIAKALQVLSKRLPHGAISFDRAAQLGRAKLQAQFQGLNVIQDKHLGWTLIHVPNKANPMVDHPLGRTLYIYETDDLRRAALDNIHRDTQTVAVSPWSLGCDLADELTLQGATRITEVGLMSRPRPGFVHDGMRPLHSMVKWVAVERGLDYRGRFRADSREEYVHRFFSQQT